MLDEFHEDYMKTYSCAVVKHLQIPFHSWEDELNGNTVIATAQSFIPR
jgi:hypothetical protein